jgi:hypothetical protein
MSVRACLVNLSDEGCAPIERAIGAVSADYPLHGLER